MVIFQVNHNSTFKRNWLRQQNCPKLTRFSHWPKLKIHIALVKTAWFPSWSLTLHWVVPAAVFPVVVLLEAPDVQQHMGSYRQKSDHCRFAVVIHCIKSLLPRCQKSSGIKKPHACKGSLHMSYGQNSVHGEGTSLIRVGPGSVLQWRHLVQTFLRVSFQGGPLSVLQQWQPHDPLNTTLVIPNFVRYSNTYKYIMSSYYINLPLSTSILVCSPRSHGAFYWSLLNRLQEKLHGFLSFTFGASDLYQSQGTTSPGKSLARSKISKKPRQAGTS